MNVDELVAIDVHTHCEVSRDGHGSLSPELLGASAAYFKTGGPRQPTIDETAAYYRERRMAAVVFTVDAEHATGHPRIHNEEVAEGCAAHSDVLIPFASIDPHRGRAGVREARRLVRDFGVRGFKFHPSLQGFAPNERISYPLYEAIEELGVPALFHTGQTGIGAGLPGGGGIRLRYSNPMLVDDVAVDFPGLTIVLAHPSFPWQDEALAVATHKPLVHIDLSGWSPKYFPPQLVRYANTLLKDKVLFGSDYPVLTPDRWLADFAALDIKPEVRPKILKENAARLLGLTPDPKPTDGRGSTHEAGRADGRGLTEEAGPSDGRGLTDEAGLIGGRGLTSEAEVAVDHGPNDEPGLSNERGQTDERRQSDVAGLGDERENTT